MYPRRFSLSIKSAQHNLNVGGLLLEKKTQSNFFSKYSLLLRQKFNNSFIKEVNKKLQEYIKRGKFYKFIEQLPKSNNSNNVIKIWVHHCECVFAQRIRRCQQMVCLYSKWWEEQALKEFIQKMKQTLSKKGKLTLGTVGITAYNWEQNKIPEDEMKKYIKELEYVYVLKENTVCSTCESTKDEKNVVCKCGLSKIKKDYDEWTPFIQQDDLLIWRRLHPSGQFQYKVYGSYNDVSAEDFLNVQVDIDYRRKWDVTAVMLEVGETDPTPDSNSDIIYWEMQWPTLFANRDYVFNRRYLIDKENNIMYIMSKSTEHPKFPKYSEKYRIEDYYSCMVIKPYTDMSKPGLEFSLTYFDNPGVNVPSSVTTWVSMRAMPDFLQRLRQATRKYKDYCIKEGVSKACKIIQEEEKLKEEQVLRDKLDYCSFGSEEKTKLEGESTPNIEEKKPQPSDQYDVQPGKFIQDIDNTESNSIPPSAGVQSKSSFWKYFQPYYYFQ